MIADSRAAAGNSLGGTAHVDIDKIHNPLRDDAGRIRRKEWIEILVDFETRNQYAVRGPGGETLLPFAEGFVKAVDLAGGRIVALRPEYVVAD